MPSYSVPSYSAPKTKPSYSAPKTKPSYSAPKTKPSYDMLTLPNYPSAVLNFSNRSNTRRTEALSLERRQSTLNPAEQKVLDRYLLRERKDIDRAKALGFGIVSRLSHGSYGNIYGTDEGRAVKLIDLGKHAESTFSQEVSLAMRIGRAGVGPQIWKSSIAPGSPPLGIIEMDKMDFSLKAWLDRTIVDTWVTYLLPLFDRLAHLNIFCTDLSLNNVMVNVDENGNLYRMVLIDFGADFCKEKPDTLNTLATYMKFVFYFNTVQHHNRVFMDMKPFINQLFQANPFDKKTLVNMLNRINEVVHYFGRKITLQDVNHYVL